MILLKGGHVVDPCQKIDQICDLLISGGVIAQVAADIPAKRHEVIDVTGKTVLPGLIDMHTHLREPGGEAKETIASGTRAAAAGGYTGITALPNTQPVLDNPLILAQVNSLIAKTAIVRVWPVGAVTKSSRGREVADIGTMARLGIVAVTDDGRGVAEAGVLKNALLLCKKYSLPLLEHCEDESLAGDGQLHDGPLARRLGLSGIPVSAETVMLARDLVLAKDTGARLHIMHVSSAIAAEMVRSAKQQGISVTAEVTPHHLLLTEEAADGYNTMAKMKPPLRTRADVDALRTALMDGTIDAVATDHAPHTEFEKSEDFRAAPFGVVGLETAFPLLYTHLVRAGHISLPALVERMSAAPARILGVPHGTLSPGYAADLTVVDLAAKKVVDKKQFYSKGRNTPFHGWTLYGIPVLTMVAGRVIMRDGYVERMADGC